jgi:hypothetical protein
LVEVGIGRLEFVFLLGELGGDDDQNTARKGVCDLATDLLDCGTRNTRAGILLVVNNAFLKRGMMISEEFLANNEDAVR